MNGVGIATADGLIIIDIDDDAAVDRVLAIVPQARAAPACIGQRGRKIFVRALDGRNIRERNITGASTAGVLELLSWHRQGVVPPTVHPKTGHPYLWIDEHVTLLTTPLLDLPTISDVDIDALRAAFRTANPQRAATKRNLRSARAVPADLPGPAPGSDPPDRWWEASPNRAHIEKLVRLFGIVHRAARDRGGQITLQAEGTDAAGKPHRPETIDIDDTQHWKHVVRIIVAVLGNTLEAYRLHMEVSRGNARLCLPGGPGTYDEVGNRRFFDSVVDAPTFEAKSGRRPRTLRTLFWWAREIEGRPAFARYVRKEGRVARWQQAFACLQAAGVERNVAAARAEANSVFRSGSKKLAIIDEALSYIAGGGGSASLSELPGVAATHGVDVRTVQRALAEAERAGILVRTRGNEGGKKILLTVPVMVEPDGPIGYVSGKSSPSLHSGTERVVSGLSAFQTADATYESDPGLEDWPDWTKEEEEPPPPPFGRVRLPVNAQDQQALDELVEQARKGRCTEETLLLSSILPPEVSHILLQIVDQNRLGRKAGAKWLRHIAGEIGELMLSEPEKWLWQLQGALDYVAVRLERTKGRPTSVKWARIFAENVGFIHEGAGRLTPMARAARAARQRWERKQVVEGTGGGNSGPPEAG